jgi:hypothetical protein
MNVSKRTTVSSIDGQVRLVLLVRLACLVCLARLQTDNFCLFFCQ